MRILIALSVVLFAGCGCITRTSKASPPVVTDDQSSPRVQPDWQQKMLNDLSTRSEEISSAWGLFSSGGIHGLGVGNYWVVEEKSGSAILFEVPLGAAKTSAPKSRNLSKDEWQAFRKEITGYDTLTDQEKSKAFDAITYEYLRVNPSQGIAQVTQRVLIYDADTKLSHGKLTSSFLRFSPEARSEEPK